MGPGIDPAGGPPIAEVPPRPTREEIERAEGATIEDVIAADLDVLLCGINPGLYSGATGYHFARPGNRFWRTLHLSGFTDRVLAPHEQKELLAYGIGITNVVRRATAGASTLTEEEFRVGGEALRAKVQRYNPRVLAVLGVSAFRIAFDDRKAKVGPRTGTIGSTRLWVLPNPSGLNAHYQLPRLIELFSELRRFLER